ncbi:electron transport complex protein RnfD [Draconibacterium orientale]|uniref:Ion-translocating oxidoreductase complex subunit D n=1 Tax=Draconibacterium orientale TaxID=1168034 RepID=X5DCW9_9BACT|nr:RnfABCDGE type electron transport complex subunit D [Draconibacterium orientale]AHW60698.1 Na+-transporting NADH:ubiquinone oxidoreductase subunit D [Draconibacterium orientale]SEU01249.1 electron transport complex protein RnfD [Draconibacterium orientale]
MSKLLTVSPSPHVHSSESTQKIMLRVVYAMIPAMLWGIYMFGLDAVRVGLISILSCLAIEFLIQKYIMKVKPSITDGSALITGVLLAFNVPVSLPWWIIIIGAIAAMGVGKLSFGGLGSNVFNPALVGRVFLLISFPVQMTSWPATRMMSVDSVSAATPLAVIKEGIKNGIPVSQLQGLPDLSDMAIGFNNGSMGEISAILLIIGGLYMLWKKVITWQTPVSIILTVLVVSGIFWLINPEMYVNPVYHVITGGLMLGAIFMATDMVTSPMTGKGQLIYGVGIGLITISIRMFGAYPEGISFAILIMNAFVPLINMYVKPKRFGGQ